MVIKRSPDTASHDFGRLSTRFYNAKINIGSLNEETLLAHIPHATY